MIPMSEVKTRLEAAFPGDRVEIRDLVGDGNHLEATVVSAQFDGKPLIQRHRLVYAALGEDVGTAIHALKVVARTPEEVPGNP